MYCIMLFPVVSSKMLDKVRYWNNVKVLTLELHGALLSLCPTMWRYYSFMRAQSIATAPTATAPRAPRAMTPTGFTAVPEFPVTAAPADDAAPLAPLLVV